MHSKLDKEIREKLEQLRQQMNVEVKVALFGQPGAGKSSLINALIGEKKANVGVETDCTTEAQEYEHNGIIFTDLPGYDTAKFPASSYFTKFDILSYDLFLCVSSGKFHATDSRFFKALQKHEKVCLFVVNKHDELWEDGVSIEELEQRKRADIIKHVAQEVPIYFTSCRRKTGLDELSFAIQDSLNNAKSERWNRSAKAYTIEALNRKKQACQSYIEKACLIAAANGLNPLPGADIAVDVGILLSTLEKIRSEYGLSDDILSKLKHQGVHEFAKKAGNILVALTTDGVLALLKRYAASESAKTVAKYVPFIGQAIACGLGYAITKSVANSYLNDCHQLAKAILENKFKAAA